MSISAIAAGISVVSGLLGASSSRKQARQAKSLARTNVELSREETAENLRRMNLERGRSLSMGRAAAGASNLQMSGSTSQYLQAMNQQWKSDMRWEERRAAIEQKRLTQGGQATASQIRAGGVASLLGGVQTAVGYYT